MYFKAFVFIVTLIIVVLIAATLGGCASVQYGGITKFDAMPVIDAKTGAVTCCEIHGVSGKEYSALNLTASKSADGSINVNVAESGTKAFEGQAISAGALQTAIDAAAKAAVAAALGPLLPTMLPAAGAALAAPGIGAAAVGAAGVIGAQQLLGSGVKVPGQ